MIINGAVRISTFIDQIVVIVNMSGSVDIVSLSTWDIDGSASLIVTPADAWIILHWFHDIWLFHYPQKMQVQ